MKILVANDDGINSRGIHELVKALHEDAGAEVYVCAPNGERSGASHTITIKEPVEVWEEEFPGAEMAFSMTGAPADCVMMGLEIYRERGIDIDMVFSGINHGANLGTDTHYSGTVNAALEGGLQNKMSVAVSLNSFEPKHFEYICGLAVRAALQSEKEGFEPMVININAPDLPAEEVKGIRISRLGSRIYDDDVRRVDDGSGRLLYTYGGTPMSAGGDDLDMDTALDEAGYATITPLITDLTDYKMIDRIKAWREEK